jgi:hypothetical protein
MWEWEILMRIVDYEPRPIHEIAFHSQEESYSGTFPFRLSEFQGSDNW